MTLVQDWTDFPDQIDLTTRIFRIRKNYTNLLGLPYLLILMSPDNRVVHNYSLLEPKNINLGRGIRTSNIMNIKQSTIDKYQKLVDILIDAKDWEKALELASRFVPGKGYIIGKTRLKSEYKIKEEDLKTLSHKIKKNPRYTSAAEMVLFLEAEVKEKFHRKQKN